MVRTTKSINSHYFVFQSSKNNAAITDHSYNNNCCWDDGVTRYPSYALLILAGTSMRYICD